MRAACHSLPGQVPFYSGSTIWTLRVSRPIISFRKTDKTMMFGHFHDHSVDSARYSVISLSPKGAVGSGAWDLCQ